jgi:hypothetical protein
MAGGVAAMLLSVVIVLNGCARVRPIYNPSEIRLGPPAGSALSLRDVANAVWTAGLRRGWRIAEVRPGELTGTLNLRSHVAVVSITHDTEKFNITYKDSTNLLHSGDMIHRNYNSWILNLERDILDEVAKISSMR